MHIVESEFFSEQLTSIAEFIAKDKKSSALFFLNTLKKEVTLLIEFPYMYKTSKYYDDTTIRDMTFKKYSIIYKVDKNRDEIVLLEIFNKNLPVLK